jgi:DNA-binding response OmpR family regulator
LSRILIVDDEEKIRWMLRKYAEFAGYEVAEAGDGMTAVQICREQDFDAIVMDVMMPELDGFSACREIFRFKRIPVLMLSARGEEYDKIHGFELGIEDYVVKPFSPREVMLRLDVLIRRNNRPAPRPSNMRSSRSMVCQSTLPGVSSPLTGSRSTFRRRVRTALLSGP